MHKYLFNILLVLLPIGSCDDPPQGLREIAIGFLEAGGVKSVSVNSSAEKTVWICDVPESESDHYGSVNGDAVSVTYKWLTVETTTNSDMVKLTASPNNERHKRSLRVECRCEGSDVGSIYVEQQP